MAALSNMAGLNVLIGSCVNTEEVWTAVVIHGRIACSCAGWHSFTTRWCFLECNMAMANLQGFCDRVTS